jgi:NAD(P)-dependent dehydrogenase (short-subunit alcohol dehydrogenase family)
MNSLDSLRQDARIAVIGAGGGIGAEFVRQLSLDERVARIHAFARRPAAGTTDLGRITTQPIDITDESSVSDAADVAVREGSLDAVIVATGILHRGDTLRPEKGLREIDPSSMSEVLAINALGPALVAKHFLPHLRRDTKTVFAALSARVGSISDNRFGGWVSYRASKAALNMILKTLAIEHARRFPGSIIVGLHPGTVDTGLSAPFQSRVPKDRLFTPEKAVKQLLLVIDSLTSADSGNLLAWDGSTIEF